jgi:hypothetical protein
MMRLPSKTQKHRQTALLSLMMLAALSSQPVLALDDTVDCDFFTGHCTGGGPFDEPHPGSGPEFPDPSEPSPPQAPPSSPPPITPPPSQPAPSPANPPPVCDRKPDLPQCN